MYLAILAGSLFVAYAVGRWAMVAVPAGLTLVGLLVAYLLDPDCSSCGSELSWFLITLSVVLNLTIPLTTLMAVGTAMRLRREHRRARR